MVRKVSITHLVYILFISLLFCHALAAYSIAGIPLQWGAQLGVVLLCFYIFVRDKIFLFPGFNPFILLFTWAVLVTLGNNIVYDYAAILGGLATTKYEVFIFLRFLGLVFFLSCILLTYWLCINGYQEKLINGIVNVAIIISLLSVYFYIAQILGLPEPPRTRAGTGGGEASTTFTYAFHRAMGTFREPSHLAEWLVVPFFLSYTLNKSFFNIKGLIMGGVLLLTGSLTGVISIIGGLFLSIIFNLNFDSKAFKVLSRIVVPVLGAFLIFSAVTLVSKSESKSIITVLWERVEPIIYDKGVHSTNRSYVYKYFEEENTPLLGDGLGNSNIKFSKFMGIEATVSFLNLFLNISFSLGIIGLLLASAFILYPIILYILSRNHLVGTKPIFLFSAYMAWMLIFFMHSEEFSLFFGVIYALVTYYLTATSRKSYAS